MMPRRIAIAALLYFVYLVDLANGYRILAIFPVPSFSHQVVFRALTLELNNRGHELVIVTPNPVNDPTLKNYTEIDIGFTYATGLAIDFIEHRRTSHWFEWATSYNSLSPITEDILRHPEVQKLYAPNSNEKFDLLLLELMLWPGLLPIAQRFDIPIIGISSLGLTGPIQYAIGNPIIPSHPGNWEMEKELSKPLSLWQRLKNFVNIWKHIYWYRTTLMSEQLAIARKYLGDDVSDLTEYEKYISLIFVTQQAPTSYPGPNTPNIINIGGFHLTTGAASLPQDLKKFLDDATGGFIYVSFGSNVKSTMLSNEDINEFVTAFSRLPYKVLWKYEQDVLPNKPDNVYLMKWFPQQAVLAHPNLKVFVYQGGLQSTEEAVAHAVPLVAFPVMGDQDMQINRMVSLGVAVKLEITAIDGNKLFEAITKVATDPSYKQRMLNVRSIMNDRPHDPLENAVWWTEYVIRHKGASHLRSSTADEPWWSRQDIGIVACISVAAVLSLGLLIVALFKIIVALTVRLHHAKQKIN